MHFAGTGPDKIDGGAFVPDHIIRTQIANQKSHVEWIAHGIERTAELSADVIGVAELQRHSHFDCVIVDNSRSNGCAAVGTKEDEAVFKAVGFLQELPEWMYLECQSAGTRVLFSGLFLIR